MTGVKSQQAATAPSEQAAYQENVREMMRVRTSGRTPLAFCAHIRLPAECRGQRKDQGRAWRRWGFPLPTRRQRRI